MRHKLNSVRFRFLILSVSAIVLFTGILIFWYLFTPSDGVLADGTHTHLYVSCHQTESTVITNFTSSASVRTMTTSHVYACTAQSEDDGTFYVLNIEPGKGSSVYSASSECSSMGMSVKGTVKRTPGEYDTIILADRIFCVENPFLDSDASL